MKVSFEEINIGDLLSADVINPNGAILARKGEIIDSETVRRLKLWGVTKINIHVPKSVLKAKVEEKAEETQEITTGINKVMDIILHTAKKIKSQRSVKGG